MDQLHLMTVFVAVAEEEGFAAASRKLNMSPPAVTRAIAALEEKLGIQLLTRTTRYVKVTEAGARYLEDVKRIIHEIELANEAAVGINSTPKGALSVTAPVMFGEKYVAPGIVEYLQKFPETQIESVFLDRVVNMLEEGFDVGVRIGKLPDSSYHARHVGNVSFKLVASPSYKTKHGEPTTPDDLKAHTLIASNANNFSHEWQFSGEHGHQRIRIQPRLNVSTNRTAINAAKHHLGIARVLSYQVADELDAGTLITILRAYTPPPLPIHIVYREGPRASNKIRAFVDLMSERLRKDERIRSY